MKKTYLLILLLLTAIALSECKTRSSDKKAKESGGINKAYIKTGSVERYSPRLDNIIPQGELPEIIAEGFEWTEGPLWLPQQDMLLFSDIPQNSVFQWSEKDGLKVRKGGVIFATGPGGVWIFSPYGDHIGTVKTGQATSNCALDDEVRYLYITADMYIMRIKLNPTKL